jgi:dihydrofolate reductase
MGQVVLSVSMSLDGFIAGPDVSVELGMGRGGERLHDWMFNKEPEDGGSRTPASDVDATVVREVFATTGAVVMGRRTFEVGVGPWGDTPLPVPCFVLTHRERDELVMVSGTFTFVTDGVPSALRYAARAAGDRDVLLMGGDVAGQFLNLGLLDALHLHLVPVVMGGGRRLFGDVDMEGTEFEQTSVVQTPYVTHLRFRVQK